MGRLSTYLFVRPHKTIQIIYVASHHYIFEHIICIKNLVPHQKGVFGNITFFFIISNNFVLMTLIILLFKNSKAQDLKMYHLKLPKKKIITFNKLNSLAFSGF